jgi:hypothetical protein
VAGKSAEKIIPVFIKKTTERKLRNRPPNAIAQLFEQESE